MYTKIISLLFFITLLLSCTLKAQNRSDSSIFIPSLGINYAYNIVGGDMKNNFGNHSSVGADLTLKFKNQWILGTSFEYYFGNDVKNEDDYFTGIKNSKGYIIDGNGHFAEVFLYERGFNIQFFTGYQFHLWAPNPNSGPFVQFGAGFMQYWVRIENPGLAAPQIKDDYKKMYDRLTNGLSTTQFFGYRYYGNRNLMNIYIGIELTQGWTKNRRSYNADLISTEIKSQLDLFTALKIGWMIPYYGRQPQEFYYY